MLAVEYKNIPLIYLNATTIDFPAQRLNEFLTKHGYLFYQCLGGDLLFIHPSVAKYVPASSFHTNLPESNSWCDYIRT